MGERFYIMKNVARWVIAIFFIVAGANHFRTPEIYYAMMPTWITAPKLINEISGACEMLGGIGLLIPATRRCAGWGLLALLVSVFPANVHVALQGHMDGTNFSPWILWARLPFQPVMMLWVWWVSLAKRRS